MEQNLFYLYMLALIETGGKQYIAAPEQVLKIEKIPGEEGGEVVFDKVLLLAEPDGSKVVIGQPHIGGAKVTGTITKQGRAKKVRVIKFKRKVRYAKKAGHRQPFTMVKISSIA